MKHACYIFLNLKVTSYNCFFCAVSGPKAQNVQFTIKQDKNNAANLKNLRAGALKCSTIAWEMSEKLGKQSISCQLTSSQTTYQLEKTGFIDVSAC